MKQGILFDLDGTLWDSSLEVTEAWNQCLREEGRAEQFTLADMHRFMGRTLENIAAMMFPQEPESEQLRLIRLCTEKEHRYLKHHAPALYPGERAVLEELAERYALGIVSNSQDGYIQIYLQQCGFSSLFCDFECAGHTGKGKGENIRLTAQRQGFSECIYVGDTQGDCDAAREAGALFVHAAYGFGTVDSSDAVLQELQQLPPIAERLFSAQ